MKSVVYFNLFVVFFLNFACTSSSTKDCLPLVNTDEVLTDIVVYIGKKSTSASTLTRFEEKFREGFKNQSAQYTIVACEKINNRYYVLIDRPARSIKAKHRAAGVSFELNNNKITRFKEHFASFPIESDSILLLSPILMEHLSNESEEEVLMNQYWTEWPNRFSYYDTLQFEWRLREELY